MAAGESDNGGTDQRVTNAILQSDIKHLGENLERYDNRVCKRLDDHEARIRSVEKGWWKPVAVGVSGVATGIWAWFAGR